MDMSAKDEEQGELKSKRCTIEEEFRLKGQQLLRAEQKVRNITTRIKEEERIDIKLRFKN